MSDTPPPEGTPIVVNNATGEVETGPPRAALHEPGRYVTPILWVLIVGSACLMYLLAGVALIVAFLAPPPAEQKPIVEVAIVLLLFTTPFSFLTGLILPSPFQRGNK